MPVAVLLLQAVCVLSQASDAFFASILLHGKQHARSRTVGRVEQVGRPLEWATKNMLANIYTPSHAPVVAYIRGSLCFLSRTLS